MHLHMGELLGAFMDLSWHEFQESSLPVGNSTSFYFADIWITTRLHIQFSQWLGLIICVCNLQGFRIWKNMALHNLCLSCIATILSGWMPYTTRTPYPNQLEVTGTPSSFAITQLIGYVAPSWCCMAMVASASPIQVPFITYPSPPFIMMIANKYAKHCNKHYLSELMASSQKMPGPEPTSHVTPIPDVQSKGWWRAPHLAWWWTCPESPSLTHCIRAYP